MAQIFSAGGVPLTGAVVISGSKNAALPIIAATLLTECPIRLRNVPDLDDVHNMLRLIFCHGKGFVFKYSDLLIESFDTKVYDSDSAEAICGKIRASCLLIGPLLATRKKVFVKMPGGCAVGARPIDLHVWALQKMGAKFKIRDGFITATAKTLTGASVDFPKKSVGATQNIMMAATLARGRTMITNASQEPEVVDLAIFLVKIGAQIQGIGTDEMIIDGVDSLYASDYSIIPDRIEAGTYLIMLAATGGKIKLKNARWDHLDAVIDVLAQTRSLKIVCKGDTIFAEKVGQVHPVNITTQPYPGFPTDLQAQFTALMCLAKGSSTITENIFEGRFMHVPELVRMGANIKVNGKEINITGVQKLNGTCLKAKDLRGGAGLLIASLAANGNSILQNGKFLDRGYEDIVYKLSKCGAQVFKGYSSSFLQKLCRSLVCFLVSLALHLLTITGF